MYSRDKTPYIGAYYEGYGALRCAECKRFISRDGRELDRFLQLHYRNFHEELYASIVLLGERVGFLAKKAFMEFRPKGNNKGFWASSLDFMKLEYFDYEMLYGGEGVNQYVYK